MGARRWSRGEAIREASFAKEKKRKGFMAIVKLYGRYWGGIFLAIGLWGGLPVDSSAQFPGTLGGLPGAGESADSENSRFPFKFIMEGVLNPTLESERNLAILTMTVRGFREHYQFAVRRAAVPELPQSSPKEMLASLDKYKVHMKILGDKELMDKIGQALPGTPMKVTGFFTRKYRELTVVDVEVFGKDGLFNPSVDGKVYQQ